MRIYPNYNIWNMFNHSLALGTMTYKKQTYDLDLLKDQLKLIKILLKDKVIKTKDTLNLQNKVLKLEKYHFSFIDLTLEMFNTKPDGMLNRKQYLIVFTNLREISLCLRLSFLEICIRRCQLSHHLTFFYTLSAAQQHYYFYHWSYH